MASYRPYRPPLGIEKALKELSEKGGSFTTPEWLMPALESLKRKTTRLNSG